MGGLALRLSTRVPVVPLVLRGALTSVGALVERIVKPEPNGYRSPSSASITIYTTEGELEQRSLSV
jgi:hypothetical protein